MTVLNRVRATVTGVAGSPYYISGYFLGSSGTPQQASDAWRAMLVAAANLQKGTLLTALDSEVTQIESTTGEAVGAVAVAPGAIIPGVATQDALPLQVQLGVRLNTPTYAAGRRIRGHFSIPGVVEPINVTGSGPNTADATVISFQTALTALVASANADLVVFSRKNGTYAAVTQATVADRWFTLRSRLG